MNDDIENAIQVAGKTAPRVTPKHIEGVIVSEHYFTAADGERFAKWGEQFANEEVPAPLHLLTFCVLVLKNGFTVTGESSCASPENFDAEIVRSIARANAVNKIWPLEGYLLKQKLHDSSITPNRGQMIEYVQGAIREGYTSYYGLPANGIGWLSDECLKVEHDVAQRYYNLPVDNNGKTPQ